MPDRFISHLFEPVAVPDAVQPNRITATPPFGCGTTLGMQQSHGTTPQNSPQEPKVRVG